MKLDPTEWYQSWRETFAATDRAGVELSDNVEIEGCCLELICIAVEDPNGLRSDEAVALYNRICRELRRVAEDELRECEQVAAENAADDAEFFAATNPLLHP